MKNSNDVRKKIKDYWIDTPDLFSEKYSSPIRSIISPANSFLSSRRKKVLSLVGPLKNKKVLDVGCGSGIFMVDFAKNGAYVVGVDYSEKMLDLAQDLLTEQKIKKSKYKLIKGDATNLPFKKREFDVILATGLADYLSKEKNNDFIKGVSRALKKEGILICGFPSKDSPFAFLRSGIGLWIREKIFRLPPIESNFTLKEIKDLLKTANLKKTKHFKVFYTMWIIVAKHA